MGLDDAAREAGVVVGSNDENRIGIPVTKRMSDRGAMRSAWLDVGGEGAMNKNGRAGPDARTCDFQTTVRSSRAGVAGEAD